MRRPLLPEFTADGRLLRPKYAPPESPGEWVTFSPRYYEVAFRAWQQELQG